MNILKKEKPRLDALIHDLGLFDSRAKAQASVMAGEVYVDGNLIEKPGTRFDSNVKIEIKPRSKKYVSRGGIKLEGALDDLKIDVRGKIILDVGSSTGGFTDCLLSHDVKKVYAIDVGYGLIDQKLRRDDRVKVLERTNIRFAKPALFDETPDMAVVDVSFISLAHVLPVLKSLNIKWVLALVKPQFEVGRVEASRGRGVIRNPRLRREAVDKIIETAKTCGYKLLSESESVLSGPKGNVEIFVYMTFQ